MVTYAHISLVVAVLSFFYMDRINSIMETDRRLEAGVRGIFQRASLSAIIGLLWPIFMVTFAVVAANRR